MALAAMAGVAPFVIGARMAGLMHDTQSARTQVEAQRMVAEKMAATNEAIMAAGFQLARESLRMWQALALGRIPDMTGATDRTASRATAPYAKRVRANAKRLSSRQSGRKTG